MQDAVLDMPHAGQLVRVRCQQWVVAAIKQSSRAVDEPADARLLGLTLVQLGGVSDDDLGEALTPVRKGEPGREIVASASG